MSEINLTAQQKEAVTELDRNVAVCAGAGSGKTRVLVQRFAYILRQGADDNDKRVLAQEILAITFTRKAATEMRERIGRELRAAAALDEEHRAYWKRQLESLERAQIGTIHSLCNSLLHSFPVEAGLDPAFTLLEESEAQEMLAEETKRFLRVLLAEKDEAALNLASIYGTKSLLEQLQALVTAETCPAADEDLTTPYAEAEKRAERALEDLRRLADNDFEGSLTGENAKRWKELKPVLLNALADLSAPESQKFLASGLFGSDKLTLRGKGSMKEILQETKNNLVPKVLGIGSCRSALQIIPLWQDLLHRLIETLRRERMARGRLTYDDLELLTVRLLTCSAEVRKRVQSRYRHIMVDEFQDTNIRQRELVYLLSGGTREHFGGTPLFVVGDPKQSIYRFRGADVGVFADVRRDIVAAGGREIKLLDNFRTGKKILTADNVVFKELMGEDSAQDVYFEALTPHVEEGETPRFYLLERGADKDDSCAKSQETADAHDAEGILIANEILRLRRSSGLRYEDMAVLLRSLNRVGSFTAAFRTAGIPYKVVNGTGFFERLEVVDLLQLFKFLLEPQNNLALTAVLRSPYFGLDDETLTRLFLRAGDVQPGGLWRALEQEVCGAKNAACSNASAAGEKNSAAGTGKAACVLAAANDEDKEDLAGDAVSQKKLTLRAAKLLALLKRQGEQLTLPDLCNYIDNVLLPEAVLNRQADGAERVANYRKFFKMAKNFAADKQGTLRTFSAWTEQQRKNLSREAAATPEVSGAIQVMTIHQSKGLEFKAVFLPALDFTDKKKTEQILYRRGAGLGIKVLGADHKLVPTPVFADLAEKEKELDRQERARLLYVAMTRPERYLYLVGGLEVTKKESKTQTWTKELKRVFEQMAAQDEAHYEKVAWKELKADNVEMNKTNKTGELAISSEQKALLDPLPDYGTHCLCCFSASALQKYLYCPRRYFYQEIERLPEYTAAEADGSNLYGNPSPVILGELIHRALELYKPDAADGIEFKSNGANENIKRLEYFWRNIVLEAAEENENIAARKSELMKLPDMLLRYVSSKTFCSIAPRLRDRELHFGQLELKSADGKSFSFNGVIDAVLDNGDGTVDLLDYKTGRVPVGDKVNEGYAWQLFIYKLAAEENFGLKVRKASLHYLQGALGGDGEPYVWSLPCSCGDMSEERLLRLCTKMGELKKEDQYRRNEKHCSRCSYKYLCREI